MSASFSLDDDLNDEQLFTESFKDIDGFGSLEDMLGEDDTTENTMDAALTAILQKAEDEINAVNDDQGSISFSDDEDDDLPLSGSEKKNRGEGVKDASPARKTLEEKRAALYTGSQPLEVIANVTAFTSDYTPLRAGAGASGLGKNGKLNFKGAVRKVMLGNRITNMLTEDAISLSQHDAIRYVSYLRNHRFEEPKMARLLPPMAIYCQKHPGVLDEVAKGDGITLLIELAFLYLTPICVLSELSRAENITVASVSPVRRKRQHPHVRISNAIGAILIQAAKRNASVFNAGHIASVVALQCKKHCITMEAASRVAWDAAAASLSTAPVQESNEHASPLSFQRERDTPLDEIAPDNIDSLSSCSTASRGPTPLMDSRGSSSVIPDLSINVNTLPLPDFSSTSPTTRKKNRRDHDLETVKTRVMQALADTYFTVDWCHAVLCILALFEPTVLIRPEILAMGMQALEYIRGRRGRHIDKRGGVTNDTSLLRMYECLMAVDQWSLLMLLNQMGKWLSISTTALMEDEEIAKDAMLSTSTKTTTQMGASAMAIVSGTFESTNSTVTLLMAFVLRSLTAQSLEARHHQNNMEGSSAGDEGEHSTGAVSVRGSRVGFSAIHMALSVMSVRRKSTRAKSPHTSAAVPDHIFDALTVLEYLIDLDEDNAFMLLCSEACDFSVADDTTITEGWKTPRGGVDTSKAGMGQRQVSPMASVIHVLLTVLADISQRYAVDYPAKNCGRIPNTVTKIVAVLNRLLRTKSLIQTGFACALRSGVSVEAISGMVSTSVGSISHDSPLLFVPTRPRGASMIGNESAGSDLGFTTFDMNKMQTHILQPFPGENPLEDLVLGSFSVCQYLWSEPQLMYTKLIDELLIHAPPNSLSQSLLNDSNRNMTRNLLGMKLREVKPLFSKFKELLLGEGGSGGGNHGKSERLSSDGFARSLAVSMGNAAISRRVSTLGATIGGGGGVGLNAHSIMNEALFSVLQDRLRELSLLTSTWINLLRDQIRSTKKCAKGEVRSVVSALIFVSDFASTLYTEGQEDTAASSVTHLGVDTSVGAVVGNRTPGALLYTAPANLKQTAFATVGSLTSLLRDIASLKGGSWQEVIDGSTLDAPLELTGVVTSSKISSALRPRRASFGASPPTASSKLRNSPAEMAPKYPLFTALSQSLTTLLRRTESCVLDALVKDGPMNAAVSSVISAHDVASDLYSLFRHIHGTTGGAISPTAEMLANLVPPSAIADYSNILSLVSAASDVVLPLIVTTITTAPSTTPSGGTRSLDTSSLGETFTLATTTTSRFRGKCIGAADLPSYFVQLTDMVERLVHAVTLHCQTSDNDVDFMGSSAVLGDENTVDQLVSLFRDCAALYTAAAPEIMQWAPQTLYHILALLLRCKAGHVAESGLVDVLLGFMHALTDSPSSAPTLSWSSHVTMMITLVNRCIALNRPLLISMRDDTVKVAISTSNTVQIPRHAFSVLALLSSRTQFGVSHPLGRTMLGVNVVTPTSVTLSSGGTRTDYLQLAALIAMLMGGDELSSSGSFSRDDVNDLLDSIPGYTAITQGLYAHPLFVECLGMFPSEGEGSPLTSDMSLTIGANPVTTPIQTHHYTPADAMSSKNQHKRLCVLDDDTLTITARFFSLARQVCDMTRQRKSVGDNASTTTHNAPEDTAAQKKSRDEMETVGIVSDELASRHAVIGDATSAFVELAVRFGTTIPLPPQMKHIPLQKEPIRVSGVDAETNTLPQEEPVTDDTEVNTMAEVVEEDSVADRALHTILASSAPLPGKQVDDRDIYEEIKEAHRRQLDAAHDYHSQQRLMLEEQAGRAIILQETISKTFHLFTQIIKSVGKCDAAERAALRLKIEMLQDDAKAAEANSKKLDAQIHKYRDRAHRLDKQLAIANSDRDATNATISQLQEEIEQLHVAVAAAKRNGEDAQHQSSLKKSKSLPEAPQKPKVVITDQVREQLKTYIDARNAAGISEIMGVIQTAQKEMEVQAAMYETELELANEAICEKQDRLELIGARIDRAVKTEEENKHYRLQISEMEEKLKRVSKQLDTSLSMTNHQLVADSSTCTSPTAAGGAAASRRPQSAMSRASNTTTTNDGDEKDIKRVTGRLVISQQNSASLQKEVGVLRARCDQLMIEGVEARRKLAHFETINTTDKGGMKWARARMKRLERRREEMLEAAAEREETSKKNEEKARAELKDIKKSSKGVEEKCERLIAGIETELELARKQIEAQKGDIRRNEMFIQELQHKSELLIAGGAALPARRASSFTSPPATHYAAAPRTSRPASAAVNRIQSVERAMRKVVGAGSEGDDNDGGKTFVVPSVTDKMPRYDATSDVHLKSYFAWKNIKKRQPATTPSTVRAKRDEVTEHRQK